MGEFIFTLAMALKCYPLPAGGLLAIEAIVLGLASPETVYHETAHNFPVIMLLMFMVAGIYFMQELLLVVFSHILVTVKSKVRLALLFTGVSAFLSAFLDALTVTAVIIMVAVASTGCTTASPLAGANMKPMITRWITMSTKTTTRSWSNSGAFCGTCSCMGRLEPLLAGFVL
jgi:Na+/H+ antiporter NhaB